LHWQELQGWPDESFVTELDHDYHSRRSRSRRRIHLIIAGCGALILIAAFFGPSPQWLAAWTCVIIGLVTVVFLAAIDAFRTHQYHLRKLPEIERDFLKDQD
jgi:peptidoglycan/LPS O-acetylase OafA/YrhL